MIVTATRRLIYTRSKKVFNCFLTKATIPLFQKAKLDLVGTQCIQWSSFISLWLDRKLLHTLFCKWAKRVPFNESRSILLWGLKGRAPHLTWRDFEPPHIRHRWRACPLVEVTACQQHLESAGWSALVWAEIKLMFVFYYDPTVVSLHVLRLCEVSVNSRGRSVRVGVALRPLAFPFLMTIVLTLCLASSGAAGSNKKAIFFF